MIGFKILSTVAVLALVVAPAASFAQSRGKGGAARGAAVHGPGGGGSFRGAGARGFSGGGGARFSGGGYRGGYANRGGGGGAVVPGLIAGAVIGGALASSYGGPGYYAPGYYDDQYDDGPVAVAPQVGGDDSVGYCMQTYRSYDPRSGTYLGTDGYRHPCP
jgi:hypothetical protein